MTSNNSFNFKRFRKKSQISLYIIIGLIVIIFFIFLISSHTKNREDKLEENKNLVNNPSVLTKTIKSEIDYCLEKSLKKGVIVSGLDGGFIYNEGEYTFQGLIPQNTYSHKLFSNLGLNWNGLARRVVVYSSIIPTIPGLSKNEFKYNGELIFKHTITGDLTNYTLKEFINCLEFNNFEGKYNISYIKYVGKILDYNIDRREIIVEGLDADVGDLIEVRINDKKYQGKIIQAVDNDLSGSNVGKKYIAKLNTLNEILSKGLNIQTLKVINLNKTPELNILFNDENIVATLRFPFYLNNQKDKISLTDSTVKLNIRYKRIYELAKLLSEMKYLNKSLNFDKKEEIEYVLKQSTYFRATDSKNLKIVRKILENTDETKKYVYSIIDYSSLINGNPFVFNFGYQNEAPYLNFPTINMVGTTVYNEEETPLIFLLVKVNEERKFNLSKYVHDKQIYDNRIFYFNKLEYHSNDADLSLTKDGILTFKPKVDKFYTYQIKVTDGDAVRNYEIVFISGFPDNSNNKAVDSCLFYKNYPDLFLDFPISTKYRDKIFIKEINGFKKAFALSPYIDNNYLETGNKLPNSEILFSKSCLYDSTEYGIKVKYATLDSENYVGLPSNSIIDNSKSPYIKIKVPKVSFPLKFKITIYSKNGKDDNLPEPFYINIYPASCLGPENNQFLSGTVQSCCNTELIDRKIEEALNSGNLNSLNFIDRSYLNIGKEYSLFGLFALKLANNMYNLEENNVWNLDPNINSLYAGKITFKCRGIYPTPFKNIERIGPVDSEDLSARIENIYTDPNHKDRTLKGLPIKLTLSEVLEKCNFIHLKTELKKNIDVLYNNQIITMILGLTNQTQKNEFLSKFSDYYVKGPANELKVICSNNWFGSIDGGYTWEEILSDYQLGGNPMNFIVSKGYCQANEVKCAGRTDVPTLKSGSDIVYACIDRYFDITSKSVKSVGADDWICGSRTVCTKNEKGEKVCHTYSRICVNGKCT